MTDRVKLRAEAWGYVHERPLGARAYTWALALKWESGEIAINNYSTVRQNASEWVAKVFYRWPAGLAECKTVPVTQRVLPARSAKAIAASKLAGRRRQAKNRCGYTASDIAYVDWAEYQAKWPESTEARADEVVRRVVQAVKGLREVGLIAGDSVEVSPGLTVTEV